MTVRPGEEWGTTGGLEPDAPIVSSDREVSLLVEQARARGEPPPMVGLVGGDLRRTLGGRRDAAGLRRPDATVVVVDVGVVRSDEASWCFVAHVVARRRGWRGRFAAVMNAEWLGEWDLAPRAHPGDGRLDVIEGALVLAQRLEARRRVRTGSHLPHPDLRVSRPRSLVVETPREVTVRVDGEVVGRSRRLEIELIPAALTVVV